MKASLLIPLFLLVSGAYGFFYPTINASNPMYTVFLHDCPGKPALNKSIYLENIYSGFNVTHSVTDLTTNQTITFNKFKQTDNEGIFSGAVAVKRLESIDPELRVAVGALYSNCTFQIASFLNNHTLVVAQTYQLSQGGTNFACVDFINSVYDIITVNRMDQQGNSTLLALNITSSASIVPSEVSSNPLNLPIKSFLAGPLVNTFADSMFLKAVISQDPSNCTWLIEKWTYSLLLEAYTKTGTLTQQDFQRATGLSICLLDLLPTSAGSFVLVAKLRYQVLFSWEASTPVFIKTSDLGSDYELTRANIINGFQNSVILRASDNALFLSSVGTFPPYLQEVANYSLPDEYLIKNAVISGEKLVMEIFDQDENSSAIIIYALSSNNLQNWDELDVFYMTPATLNNSYATLIDLSVTTQVGTETFFLSTDYNKTWINQIVDPVWTIVKQEPGNSTIAYNIYIYSLFHGDTSEIAYDIPLYYFDSSYFQVSQAPNTTSSVDVLYPQQFNLNGNLLGISGPSLAYNITDIPSAYSDYRLLRTVAGSNITLVETDSQGTTWMLSFTEEYYRLTSCHSLHDATDASLNCNYFLELDDFCDAEPYRLFVQAFPLITIYFGFPGTGLGGFWVGLAEKNGSQWTISNYYTSSQYNYSSSCIDVIIPDSNPNFLYCLALDANKAATSVIAYNLTDLLAQDLTEMSKIAIESPSLPKGAAFQLVLRMDSYKDFIILTNHVTHDVAVYQTNFLVTGPTTSNSSTITIVKEIKVGKDIVPYLAWASPLVVQKTGVYCVYFGEYGLFEEWRINGSSTDQFVYSRQSILYGGNIDDYQGSFPFGRADFSQRSGNLYLFSYDEEASEEKIFVYNLFQQDSCSANCTSSRKPRGTISSSNVGAKVRGIQVGSIANSELDLGYIWGVNQSLIITYQREAVQTLFTGMVNGSASIQIYHTQFTAYSKLTPNIMTQIPLKVNVYKTVKNITLAPNATRRGSEINIFNTSNFTFSADTYFSGCVLKLAISSSDLSDIGSGNIRLKEKLRTLNSITMDYEIQVDEKYSAIVAGQTFLFLIGSKGVYIGKKAPLFNNQTFKFNLLTFPELGTIQNGDLIVNPKEDVATFVESSASKAFIFNPQNRTILHTLKDLNGIQSASITQNYTSVFFLPPLAGDPANSDSPAFLFTELNGKYRQCAVSYKTLCKSLNFTINSNMVLAADTSSVNTTTPNVIRHISFMLLSDPLTKTQSFYACQTDVNHGFQISNSQCQQLPLLSLIWDYNTTEIYCNWTSVKILYASSNCTKSDCKTKFYLFLLNGNFNSYNLLVEIQSELTITNVKILGGFKTYLPNNSLKLVGANREHVFLKMKSNYTSTQTLLPISNEHLLLYNLSKNSSQDNRTSYSMYDVDYYSTADYSSSSLGFDTYTNKLFILSKSAVTGDPILDIKGIFPQYEILFNASANITSDSLTLTAINFGSSRDFVFKLVYVDTTKKTLVLFYMFVIMLAVLAIILIVYAVMKKFPKNEDPEKPKDRSTSKALL